MIAQQKTKKYWSRFNVRGKTSAHCWATLGVGSSIQLVWKWFLTTKQDFDNIPQCHSFVSISRSTTLSPPLFHLALSVAIQSISLIHLLHPIHRLLFYHSALFSPFSSHFARSPMYFKVVLTHCLTIFFLLHFTSILNNLISIFCDVCLISVCLGCLSGMSVYDVCLWCLSVSQFCLSFLSVCPSLSSWSSPLSSSM